MWKELAWSLYFTKRGRFRTIQLHVVQSHHLSKVHVPGQYSERSCTRLVQWEVMYQVSTVRGHVFVLGVSILTYDFWIVPTVWYYYIFLFMNTTISRENIYLNNNFEVIILYRCYLWICYNYNCTPTEIYSCFSVFSILCSIC